MDISKALETFLGSYIAAGAILIVAAGILIWKIAASISNMKNKVAEIEKLPCADHSDKLEKLAAIGTKVDAFPCHLHTEKIERHNDQLSMTNELLQRLEGKMDILVKLMPLGSSPKSEQRFSDDVPAFSQKHSPKVLNDNGKLVFRIFDCDGFLEANADWLLSEVAKFNPKTALDVEAFSYSALLVASLDDRFNGIKNQIYKSPAVKLSLESGQTKDIEISLEDVLYVMSIPLRDRYLARHPEILPE